MAWVALVAAGLFETAFAVCLKLSDGLRVLWPTVGFAVSALTSFGLLMVALRDLEVGPAYAVWTGIGAAGAASVGMIFLGDSVSTVKLVSIALILAGVIGINLSGVSPGRRDGGPRGRGGCPRAAACPQTADNLDHRADGDRGAEGDDEPGPKVVLEGP